MSHIILETFWPTLHDNNLWWWGHWGWRLDFSFSANQMSFCRWVQFWPSISCCTDDLTFVLRIFWYKVESSQWLSVCKFALATKKAQIISPPPSGLRVGLCCLSLCDFYFLFLANVVLLHNQKTLPPWSHQAAGYCFRTFMLCSDAVLQI